MEATWDLMKTENAISEETRVKVRVGTAWLVLSTIVGTTIWLTGIMLKVQSTNQEEHVRMLSGITALNVKSENWITRDQFENGLIYVAKEFHGKSTNWTRWRELQLREGIRDKLRSPKDSPP
jgi:hypothetical protein